MRSAICSKEQFQLGLSPFYELETELGAEKYSGC